ncbi:hypothetical protein scyTo_0017786 [Scyliorhinus torazame]|uniref:Uncharacterized protein n=1 Tax=Scyliorhinus torazame TaxID=75743 RepID=A0A401Q099_SCYTO|nr:hypothetical protein [Scyliorhinus torazame]
MLSISDGDGLWKSGPLGRPERILSTGFLEEGEHQGEKAWGPERGYTVRWSLTGQMDGGTGADFSGWR